MEGEWTDKRMDDFADRIDRFEANVDRRFDRSDARFERRMDKLDARLDRWGKVVTSGVIAIVVGVIVKLIGG